MTDNPLIAEKTQRRGPFEKLPLNYPDIEIMRREMHEHHEIHYEVSRYGVHVLLASLTQMLLPENRTSLLKSIGTLTLQFHPSGEHSFDLEVTWRL